MAASREKVSGRRRRLEERIILVQAEMTGELADVRDSQATPEGHIAALCSEYVQSQPIEPDLAVGFHEMRLIGNDLRIHRADATNYDVAPIRNRPTVDDRRRQQAVYGNQRRPSGSSGSSGSISPRVLESDDVPVGGGTQAMSNHHDATTFHARRDLLQLPIRKPLQVLTRKLCYSKDDRAMRAI